MCDLVARTGRQHQRYQDGCRLVAGCIPFRYRNSEDSDEAEARDSLEVLMINSMRGSHLLFPKGGWEKDETKEEAAMREAVEEAGVRGDLMGFLGCYDFKSRRSLQSNDSCPQGRCKAAMFALLVKEELDAWPEQSTRRRLWLSIPQAAESCHRPWMRRALLDGFLKWHQQEEEAAAEAASSDHLEEEEEAEEDEEVVVIEDEDDDDPNDSA